MEIVSFGPKFCNKKLNQLDELKINLNRSRCYDRILYYKLDLVTSNEEYEKHKLYVSI